MFWIILGVIISYIIGSIPTAYILGRVFKKKDLRLFGSHNIGATNAFRVFGKGIGISALLIDIVKGFIPVVIIGNYIVSKNMNFSDETIRVLLGLFSAIGHNWTLFLKFKGGKGVAVSLGVLIGLAVAYPTLRIVFGYVLVIWIISFLISKMVSLASLLSGISLPVFMFLFKERKEFIIAGIILSILIILRHRSNIKRILQGKEYHFK